MKRVLLCLLVFLLSTLDGCRSASEKKKTDPVNAISVTDFRGKSVVLSKPGRRIVCLLESALSGLYMLDAGKMLVGVPASVFEETLFKEYARLDPRLAQKRIPAPGNWDFVNIESVIALQPDLVILWADQTEAIQNIESYNIPVYGVRLKSFDDVYKEISDLGVLTGRVSRANYLISEVKNELDTLYDRIKTVPHKKRAYFMWSQGLLETSGAPSSADDLLTSAGLINVCGSDQEHVIIHQEDLLQWNPDIIIMWCNPLHSPEDILNLRAWQNLKAVSERKVFELPSPFECDFWTLKFAYSVKMIARWAYPDRFPQVDPVKEKTSMMTKLYGTY